MTRVVADEKKNGTEFCLCHDLDNVSFVDVFGLLVVIELMLLQLTLQYHKMNNCVEFVIYSNRFSHII